MNVIEAKKLYGTKESRLKERLEHEAELARIRLENDIEKIISSIAYSARAFDSSCTYPLEGRIHSKDINSPEYGLPLIAHFKELGYTITLINNAGEWGSEGFRLEFSGWAEQ